MVFDSSAKAEQILGGRKLSGKKAAGKVQLLDFKGCFGRKHFLTLFEHILPGPVYLIVRSWVWVEEPGFLIGF